MADNGVFRRLTKKAGLSILASSIRPVLHTLPGFRPGSYQEAHLFS
jgi:hypothetical protein